MAEETVSKNFIEQEIDKDLAEGVYTEVCTRFPPEPNGYLHIGHAKSILLNSGLAKEYGGTFHLRFDDTNPMKEDMEFVESIKEDVQWLGADYKDHLYFASNYFDTMYECAVKLIKKGKAYVCDLSADEIREYRGTLTEPGKNSPYRDRSVEENLDLFERMKNGEFEDVISILARSTFSPSANLPFFISSNKARFSSTLLLPAGSSFPGSVSVPRYSRISSALRSETYAFPFLISFTAASYI